MNTAPGAARGPRPRAWAPAVAALAAAVTLTACGSSPSATPAATGTGAAEAQSVAPTTSAAQARTEAGRRDMTRPGPEFARALTERGIPADRLGDVATLAQLARGICMQTAAGTPEAEITEHLRPVIRYTATLVGPAMTDVQLAEEFIGAAHDAAC